MKTGLVSVHFGVGFRSEKIFRLRQEDSKKGVKLMTADSNYEIRLLGAKVILNMAQQSTTQTKERLLNPERSLLSNIRLPGLLMRSF